MKYLRLNAILQSKIFFSFVVKISEVKSVNISADGGQRSLKLCLQVLFDDVSGKISHQGVRRTYIAALMPSVPETRENVKHLFNSVNFDDLLALGQRAGFEVFIIADCKMQNLIVGIGTHSSRYPSIYSLWSKNERFSQPNVRRTVDSILKNLEIRTASNASSINSFSVESRPSDLVMWHP